MRTRRPPLVVVVVALTVLAFAACTKQHSSDTLGLGSSSTDSRGATTGSVTEWLGILRVATDVNDLDADTQVVKAVVDGSIVVSPVACFEGSPRTYGPDSYVLGVVAPTKEALDVLLTTLGRPVLFEGQITTMCLD